MVAQAASRALGVLISKYKSHGGLPFTVYSRLYDALVQPILDNGAAVWGTRGFSVISANRHRACRAFLGVGKSAPTAAILAYMGWTCPLQRQWITVLRQWCRLSEMNDTRLNQRVFAWVRRNPLTGTCNNSYKVIHFLRLVGLEHIIEINIIRRERQTLQREINEKLERYYISQWKDDINGETATCGRGKNKLRKYCIIKHSYETESYVKIVLNRRHRSALANIRCGAAHIRLETGRFECIPEEERL